MKTNSIGNEAISASAGSGKTFQLAQRYIKLLANDIDPARIIALTFSRKAAGEIFDSIVNQLCLASSSPEQAKTTGGHIQKPDFKQNDFLRLLREFVINLHRLHISTLDSFTISILRSFPLELGIPQNLQLLENDSALSRRVRQEVISKIFNTHKIDNTARKNLLNAFKQATFGQEEKSLERNLDIFTGEYRKYYQIMPLADMWGQKNIIWPDGSPWFEPAVDLKDTVTKARALFQNSSFPDKLLDTLINIIDFAGNYTESTPWDKTATANVVFPRLSSNINDLKQGTMILQFNKKEYPFTAGQCELIYILLCHLFHIELSNSLERTRGIYLILDQYEQFYDDITRRQGKFTFDDAQYMLTAANHYSDGILLSQTPGQDSRLYIDYRLDCKLDHWLLDEFQDTSDLQWEVLRNLVDEILQDTSNQRSFFYVGDVKQAIYGWRGGNARLFRKILEQYPGRIQERPLSISFRSSQPVIDTINKIFRELPPDIPPQTAENWEKVWQKHECRQGIVPDTGYAALLEPQCDNGEYKPTDEDRYHIVANLLKEIDPVNRGLSTAILVRSNKSGRELVNFLRYECQSMNIIHEGKAIIKDNPVVSVLLALVKFAAHPGDTLAWRHLEMSPLNNYFSQKQYNRNNISLILLRKIQREGFQSFIREWGMHLDNMHRLDEYGWKKLNDLINAAAEFDKNQSYDCNEFLNFIENYETHELTTENAVRIMTVHQAKGLGFDIVILPDLLGKSIYTHDQPDFLTARNAETDHPLWTLKMPRQIIAENDDVLQTQIQANDETACFDELCVLYVALTRAKQGLYIITSFPGKTSASLTSAALIKLQLIGDIKPSDGPKLTINGEDFLCHYQTGERDWYLKIPQKTEAAGPFKLPDIPADFAKNPSKRRRLLSVSPSMLGEGDLRADLLFTNAIHDSQEFGTAIHALFEKVTWLDELNIEDVIRNWQETSPVPENIKQKAIDQFRQTLTSADILKALSRPDGNIDLWREKHFEIVLDNQWITGIFDRVTIARDTENKPLKTTIIDFKSNEITSDADLIDSAERYRPQLTLYGRVVERMLQIAPSCISLQILFTHPGKLYELK